MKNDISGIRASKGLAVIIGGCSLWFVVPFWIDDFRTILTVALYNQPLAFIGLSIASVLAIGFVIWLSLLVFEYKQQLIASARHAQRLSQAWYDKRVAQQAASEALSIKSDLDAR